MTILLRGTVRFFYLGSNLLNGDEVFICEHGLRARAGKRLSEILLGLRGAGKDFFDFFVGPWNDMDAD
jgi:hypothetical protein